jgi:ABC-type polysaccharide/polyol phosphate transport system ATPase subunit
MSDVAVRFSDVGKLYKVFPSRAANLVDALGLGRLVPGGRVSYREFWALRNISFDLKRGSRLGIIGRNGAGKTTLLKLVTRNLAASEGTIEVAGEVQALLDAMGGFHPEFTGRENIRAALTYRGLNARAIRAAEDEIADFTELGDFLDRPFKTFSLGMQTRLSFAVATTLIPDILIVDEILGAGDLYFLAKSTERMRALISTGASVLLVSHALDQVMMFCEEAMWLDRGRIVSRGSSMEVCKAYEKFIRLLDDKRIRAKNRKQQTRGYSSLSYDNYADNVVVRVTASGPRGGICDVSEVRLVRDGELDDFVRIGDAQDTDTMQSAFVVSEAADWSRPTEDGGTRFRRLSTQSDRSSAGSVIFYLYALFAESAYLTEVTYRSSAQVELTLDVLFNGKIAATATLPASSGEWATAKLSASKNGRLADSGRVSEAVPQAPTDGSPTPTPVEDRIAGPQLSQSRRQHSGLSRWPGEGSFMIERVVLAGTTGAEQAVFRVGEPLNLEVTFTAKRSGIFPLTFVAVLFRRDGVLVSRHIGTALQLSVSEGETRVARLELGPLNLGNGHYVFSIALYKELDIELRSEATYYDLIDRSFDFEVFGTPPLVTAVFQHPGIWKILGRSEVDADQ